MSSLCTFNGCSVPAMPASSKCTTHKHRQQCSVDACTNQVYARHLCVRHGGKRLCSYAGCTSNARNGSRCCKHGAASIKQTCCVDGCTKIAHARRLCVSHGGGRRCIVDGCQTHARRRGFCMRHAPHAVSPTPSRPKDFDPFDPVHHVKPTEIEIAAACDAFMEEFDLALLDGCAFDLDAYLMLDTVSPATFP
ncbi:hypothetical protein H310_08709 [Aphanomyces invadans]|uniref:Uncharacterized protein n=1 Tax=Aphanomyces invadans TaxID=157072 RepID=A0A024TX38_9STRA|nr:hypothetical protein H310_08709 [Aphanomyces invadans]ETV98588.1 hypothetical protein H310_08709 [Aphanomyces invadans]|eukprot:XP_008872785.1 hypothetical protein H310_08709 [Aphanomyces invadans]